MIDVKTVRELEWNWRNRFKKVLRNIAGNWIELMMIYFCSCLKVGLLPDSELVLLLISIGRRIGEFKEGKKGKVKDRFESNKINKLKIG